MNLPKWFIDYLKAYEGYKGNAYQDKVGKDNPWTIGYGTTVYDNGNLVKEGEVISKTNAEKQMIAYINKNMEALKKNFKNWDKFPEQTKLALVDFTYRGGVGNFSKNSPNFTKAVDNAYADGKLTMDEFRNIANETGLITNGKKADNLTDRKQRRLAMLANMYNPNHYNSINHATTTKVPYFNFANNVLSDQTVVNTLFRQRWGEVAPFMKQQADPYNTVDRKLNYKEETGYDVIYPELQKQGINYLDLQNDSTAYKKAVEAGDTLHIPSGIGKYYVPIYKRYFNTTNNLKYKK